MRRRFAARSVLLAGVLVLAAVWGVGCADNPSTSVLEPPGGQGGVIGRIVFQGASGTLPQARITPTIAGPSPCSGFGAIAVLGTLNAFSTAEAPNYAMRQIAACEWAIELQLEEGPLDIKLVTGPDINSVAFDSPGDYGVLAANNNDDPLEGTLDNPANGPDGNLSVSIPSTGLWTIYLDENTDPASYRITQDVLIPLSDPTDGTFEIIGLPVGTIGLVIEAEGYSPVTLSNIEVQKNKVTDLGDITMDPIAGALTGTVAFADNPSSPPTAQIQVRNATTLSLVDTVSTTGTFSIEGLATGTYLLWIRADGYQNFRAQNVDYVNGQNTDVGTKTLSPGCGSGFLTIQLAGEFSGGFDLAVSPFMTEGPGCVWTDTLEVEPGNYNFKFVTDRAFDNDYGSDETTLNLPGTYAVEAGVGGEGTAINVEVAAAGEYIFTLDEENQEFTASFVGEIPSGSISGTVGFSDMASPPLPEATVRVLRAGTTTEVASATSDTQTGAFLFDEIVEGTYDVEVSADGYLPQVLADRTVTLNQNTDLGTVVLQVAETTLHGTVAFSDSPSPLPEATVEVRDAATSGLVKSKTATAGFSFEGLVSGAYFLRVRADGYQNAWVLAIDYVDGEDYDVGTVTLDPGCGSEFLTIQLAGEVTSWDLGQAPFMTEGPGCVWTDTVQVEPGNYNMKFVTDGAFDNDYGSDEVTVTLPGTYPVIAGVSGEGTAVNIEVAASGEYVFTLDEQNLEFTASFVGEIPSGSVSGTVAFEDVAAPPLPEATVQLLRAGTSTEVASQLSDPVTGAFGFEEVPEGTYDVRVSAAGYLPGLVTGAVVVVDQSTDLGTITMEVAGGRLTGVVDFADAPSIRPVATVAVRRAGEAEILESAETDSAFAFTGLPSGAYDLEITAPGYLAQEITDISYVNGEDKDIGTVTLEAGCQSDFNSITPVGDFNGWNLSAPSMSAVIPGGCTWVDTLSLQAGSYFMKFVTDGAFDNPPDYGGDEGTELALPGGPFTIEAVTGQGTALNIAVTATGDYIFTLDEGTLEFTVALIGEAPQGSITGTVGFAGVAAPPYPVARVQLFATGSTTSLRTALSDTLTGAFTFNSVADGTYDLSFAASCFTTETRTSVTVAGDTQDVGTVTLAEGGSSFTTIQIAGEFTSWNLAEAPSMTPGAACTWADTLDITPGTYNFKFVTDGAFDNPGDYGGDQVELTLPGTYGVIAGVSGEGTAIRVTVDAEANYIITLNERTQEFSAETLSAAPGLRSRPAGD